MNLIRTLVRRWKITVPAASVVLAGLAWLAFGYFGIHTAFIDETVDEAVPVFDAAPAPSPEPVAEVAEAADVPEAAGEAVEPTLDVEAGETTVGETTVSDDDPPAAAPSEAPPAEETAEAAANTVMTTFAGQFGGLGRYDVSGDALVLANGTDQRFLRFENFESDNGPDLNVYLINPDDPDDFVDLGDLSGNIGNQNYEIPPEVDLDRYSQVGIWCVRFSVGFGTADLSASA